MGRRRYSCDDSYFSIIDTEAKAYLLGFLMADGCIYKKQVILSLAVNDLAMVERFRSELKIESAVRRTFPKQGFSSNTEMATVRFTSPQVVADLARQGIHSRKTFTGEPWKAPQNRPDLQTTYWRGCVDGDGWLCFKNNQGVIGFCGNQSMVNGFAAYATIHCPSKIQVGPDKKIWRVAISGTGVVAPLVAVLYKDSTIHLDRKKAVADTIVSHVQARPRRYEIDENELQSLYGRGVSARQLAKQFETSIKAVNLRLGRTLVTQRTTRQANDLRFTIIDADKIADMKHLYEVGRSCFSIAQEFGVNHNTLRRELIRQGVEWRGNPNHRNGVQRKLLNT